MPGEPISVTEVVGIAKRAVKGLPSYTVMGEISSFKGPNYRSGHCYFELKDESSVMSVVVWRSVARRLDFEIKDGLEVVVRGDFDVFAPQGRLNFIVSSIEMSGEGALRKKVAALAKRLAAEGLMADEAKRPIPVFCERVALVTSLSGSVKDDVLRTLARRNPLVEVDMAACSVQGSAAPASIVRALSVAEAAGPDAILLVRGGGSYEDLMAFNDERVARAIAASTVPVVTGIGHEPDVTIADMVADRRQSTPTAAAESVAPSFSQLVASIDGRANRMGAEAARRLEGLAVLVDGLGGQLPASLVRMIEHRREVLGALERTRPLVDPGYLTEDRLLDLERQEERMADALPRGIARQRERMEGQALRLGASARRIGERERHRLQGLASSLEALSPLAVLGRGYAIVRDAGGRVVARAGDTALGQDLSVLLGDGSIDVEVTAIGDGD